MPETTAKRSLWLGIIQWAATVGVTLIFASFLLGGKRERVAQKVTTLEAEVAAIKAEWKAEKQHITDMDLQGSVATKNFVKNYDLEQGKQYKRLEHIEIEIGHLDRIELRLDNLERVVWGKKKSDDDPPPKPNP